MQEAPSLNREVCGNPSRGARTLCVALAAFVSVLSLLLAPSEALASAAAPMCNELAQSIEAPPTIWPHRGGSIRALPSCPLSKFSQADMRSDRIERVPPSVLREAPVAVPLNYSIKPASVRLQVPSAPRLVLHPGHVSDVYRPPRV
jgi:hypothetical protein